MGTFLCGGVCTKWICISIQVVPKIPPKLCIARFVGVLTKCAKNCTVQSIVYEKSAKTTYDAHMHNAIYAANVLDAIVLRDMRILLLMCPIWCFFIVQAVTS